MGDVRTLDIVLRRSNQEWAEGRRIPEELTVQDLGQFFWNLRASESKSADEPPDPATDIGGAGSDNDGPPIEPAPAVAPIEEPRTDLAVATRNVAASVVASVLLALGVVALVEQTAKRRAR